MRISVQVPTKNESKQIVRFIENVKGVADEILLIDSSTDDTVKKARQLTDKVRVLDCKGKEYDGLQNIGKKRNRGLKSAPFGWYVLYLDADEVLSDELISEIQELKDSKGVLNDIYLIKRSHFFNYGNCTAHLTTRFIRGEPKLHREGTIKFIEKTHERAVGTLDCYSITNLKGCTLHFPEINKYSKKGDYHLIHLKDMPSKVMIKQALKYILICDYNPKYWIGNLKLIINTLRGALSC